MASCRLAGNRRFTVRSSNSGDFLGRPRWGTSFSMVGDIRVRINHVNRTPVHDFVIKIITLACLRGQKMRYIPIIETDTSGDGNNEPSIPRSRRNRARGESCPRQARRFPALDRSQAPWLPQPSAELLHDRGSRQAGLPTLE